MPFDDVIVFDTQSSLAKQSKGGSNQKPQSFFGIPINLGDKIGEINFMKQLIMLLMLLAY